MKVLFWVPYPTHGPSNRFRVEQYLPYLHAQGISYSVRPFWANGAYALLHKNGHYLKKILFFLRGIIYRAIDILNLSDYDLVFVHREALPLRSILLERIAAKFNPVVYDFDDSIFLPSAGSTNNIVHILKNHQKIKHILKLSTNVIAGNNYLKAYAEKYNRNVMTIPTVIDTDKYIPLVKKRTKEKIIIGWMGTYGNSQYLNIVKESCLNLTKKYGESIQIVFVGCRDNYLGIPGIIYKRWLLSSELTDLQNFDIGIMPIWDDDWTRGKCAFKIIQYMATGASVVASPAGMNKEIIQDGENGFLANNDKDWFVKLSLLVDNPQLRTSFAIKGRSLIEKRYSLKAISAKFIDTLMRAYAQR